MLSAFKTTFFSWQFWVRISLAFLLPYALFSTIMQQAAISIDRTIDRLDIKPRIAIVYPEKLDAILLNNLKEATDWRLMTTPDNKSLLISDDSVDVVLTAMSNTELELTYDVSQSERAIYAIFDLIKTHEESLVASVLDSLQLEKAILNPIQIKKNNLFSPMNMMSSILDQVKSSLANILNLLFILLISWIVRSILIRHAFANRSSIFAALLSTFTATMLATAVVFIGFQMGVNTDAQGMIQNLVFSINKLLAWNTLSSLLWIWWPTWLFIIALLGTIIYNSKNMVRAITRSFWLVVGIHILALYALMPIQEISTFQTTFPIQNTFAVGQLALQETLTTSTWLIALFANLCWAILFIFIWSRQQNDTLPPEA